MTRKSTLIVCQARKHLPRCWHCACSFRYDRQSFVRQDCRCIVNASSKGQDDFADVLAVGSVLALKVVEGGAVVVLVTGPTCDNRRRTTTQATRRLVHNSSALTPVARQYSVRRGKGGLRGYLLICALARVLKCALKPTTAAEASGFTLSLSTFTANTVNR